MSILRLFKNITRTKVLPALTAASIDLIPVPLETKDGVHVGIEVECNDVKCVFEFRLFEYIGDRVAASSSAPSADSSISMVSSDNYV